MVEAVWGVAEAGLGFVWGVAEAWLGFVWGRGGGVVEVCVGM